MVKSAKDLLKKYQQEVNEKPKKSFSLSLDDEQMTKLDYLAKVTKTTKNEIVRKALIVFGLDDIKIPNDFNKRNVSENNNPSSDIQQNY